MVTIALVPGAAALDGCVDRVHGRHPADVAERCQRAPTLRMGNVRPEADIIKERQYWFFIPGGSGEEALFIELG